MRWCSGVESDLIASLQILSCAAHHVAVLECCVSLIRSSGAASAEHVRVHVLGLLAGAAGAREVDISATAARDRARHSEQSHSAAGDDAWGYVSLTQRGGAVVARE